MSDRHEYVLMVRGIKHVVLYSDEKAAELGLERHQPEPVEVRQVRPANKQVRPRNKGAS